MVQYGLVPFHAGLNRQSKEGEREKRGREREGARRRGRGEDGRGPSEAAMRGLRAPEARGRPLPSSRAKQGFVQFGDGSENTDY